MDRELLVNEQIEAGAEFVRIFNDYAHVSGAFWIIPSESKRWNLYIASDQINDANMRDASRELIRLTGGKRSQWFDPYKVRFVNSASPIARAAIEIRDLYSIKTPMRYGERMLGNMFVEGLCIYPPLVPDATAVA